MANKCLKKVSATEALENFEIRPAGGFKNPNTGNEIVPKLEFTDKDTGEVFYVNMAEHTTKEFATGKVDAVQLQNEDTQEVFWCLSAPSQFEKPKAVKNLAELAALGF